MTERQYQAKLIKKIAKIFPGCIVLKMDTSLRQGLLDLLVLWDGYWASLEVKSSANSAVQPNQDYYVKRLNEMSFAAYIYPENEKEVLGALQQAFKPPRRARLS